MKQVGDAYEPSELYVRNIGQCMRHTGESVGIAHEIYAHTRESLSGGRAGGGGVWAGGEGVYGRGTGACWSG